MHVNAQTRLGNQTIALDRLPERCPICHHNIHPVECSATYLSEQMAERVFRCPSEKCERLFVARYIKNPIQSQPTLQRFVLSECAPVTIEKAIFSDIIRRVSAKFCEIYNQASAAEQQGLLLVCGPGYRKALEFLVKDYLCANNSDKSDEIKKTFLGTCIKEHITNDRIVAVAARAAWLGNDETHYLRTWEERDLTDLKRLINLASHWIEIEEQTREAVDLMPDGGPLRPKSAAS